MTSISSTNPKTFFTKKKRFGFAPYGTSFGADSLQIVGKVHFTDSSQNLIPKKRTLPIDNSTIWTYNKNKKSEIRIDNRKATPQKVALPSGS